MYYTSNYATMQDSIYERCSDLSVMLTPVPLLLLAVLVCSASAVDLGVLVGSSYQLGFKMQC
jgi:hypothetical protein